MKMFLSPAAVKPKGKPRDVFDSVMGINTDKKKPKKDKKKDKPWKNKKK